MTAASWVPRFTGDTNEALGRVQGALRDTLAALIFWRCQDAFRVAEDTLGLHTEVGEALRSAEEYWLASVHLAYDLMTAGVRRSRPDLLQASLPFEGRSFQEELEVAWREAFAEQLRRLLREPPFVRAMVTACLKGPEAEVMSDLEATRSILRWPARRGSSPAPTQDLSEP